MERPRSRWMPASMAVVMTAAVLASGADPAAAATTVTFADPDLQAAVNAAVDWSRDPATPVTTTEAESLTGLYDANGQIDALGGIQALKNLTDLTLLSSRISDLRPLDSLTKLESLDISGNRVVDLRPVGGLPKLRWLFASDQVVALASIPTTAIQPDPLFDVTGAQVVPRSSTAVVTKTGWQLNRAGSHTLTWDSTLSWRSGAAYGQFSGTITQESTGQSVFAPVGTPKVTGTARVGATLTASPGTWDKLARLSYQWLRNGAVIAGASAKTYVVPANADGARFAVRVTASADGYTPVTVDSAPTAKAMRAPKPTVSGKLSVGAKLVARTGTWTSGVTKKLQWYGDGRKIPGATKGSFTITTSQQGMKLSVRVTGTKSGYATVTMASDATRTFSLVDTSSKASVAAAYKKLAKTLRVPTKWTGSTARCKPGTESSASKTATMDAINYVRAMNQLDGVRFDAKWNTQAMKNSLMMQARGQITHYPAKSGKCWSSEGAKAASTSNLSISWGGSKSVSGATGARAVLWGYMDDPGASNVIAGHRRWILYPTTTVMGTGSSGTANTLKVIGTSQSDGMAQPKWMEWPSAGYFPKQLDPEGLWSLSTSTATDFSSVKVRVVDLRTGKKLKTTVYPTGPGYGVASTTFRVAGVSLPKGSQVRSYRVTVSGISGGPASSYTWTVKYFDPNG